MAHPTLLPLANFFTRSAVKKSIWFIGGIWWLYGCSSPTPEEPAPVPEPVFPVGAPATLFDADVAVK